MPISPAASRATGRSPRQRIEQDRVEVLAGLRHGWTLGTPLALVVANRDHENWRWGMSPGRRRRGQRAGDEAGHPAAPGSRRPGGDAEVRARRRAQHARAGERAPDGDHGRRGCRLQGASPRARRRGRGLGSGDGRRRLRSSRPGHRRRRRRSPRRGVPPGLGSYATKEDRLDGRLAAALMGIQAVKGVEIGRASGSRAARLPGARRDPSRGSGARRTVPAESRRRLERRGDRRACGDEAAADADAAAAIGRPRNRRTGRGTRRAERRRCRRSARRRRRGGRGLRARPAAREKFGGDSLEDVLAAHRAYFDRIPWRTP